MADTFPHISEELRAFIEMQHMFFVATAAPGSRINLSPKGCDSLRVINATRVLWLNLTGSGNETAAHLLLDPRMTLMFCAFDRTPMILRLYGQGRAYHPRDPEWGEWRPLFPEHIGARQIMALDVELVQTSCGYAVPRYDFVEQRPTLDKWTERKGEEGVAAYWRDFNHASIDGLPTGIVPKGD